MPTILRLDSLRVAIYPNDHRPAHVHVIGPDGEAVFVLNCHSGPPALRESYGLSLVTVNRILDGLMEALDKLCDGWKAIHGDF